MEYDLSNRYKPLPKIATKVKMLIVKEIIMQRKPI